MKNAMLVMMVLMLSACGSLKTGTVSVGVSTELYANAHKSCEYYGGLHTVDHSNVLGDSAWCNNGDRINLTP